MIEIIARIMSVFIGLCGVIFSIYASVDTLRKRDDFVETLGLLLMCVCIFIVFALMVFIGVAI